jgi:hypothetical protein
MDKNALPQIFITLGSPVASAAPTPSVGIFWGINGVLAIDYSAITEAEQYGECTTHARGHYDCWQHWQALGARRLKANGCPSSIMYTEYEVWPRGRIVFDTSSKGFILYADQQLQKSAIVAALKTAFGIAEEVVTIRSDLHYRTTAASWD